MIYLVFIILFISIFILVAFNQQSLNYYAYVIINKSKIKVNKYLVRKLSIFVCWLCIATYLFLRWFIAIDNIVKYKLFNSQPSEFRSANLSIFFMLDLCSLLGILLPILKIFDNNKKTFLIPISYLAVLGGGATILFTIPDLYINHSWDFVYFIFGSINEGTIIGNGNGDEPLMFLMHLWMVLIGLHTIITTNKVKIRDFIIMVAFILIYAGYIYIMSQGLDIKSHVTAIVKGDYEPIYTPSEYYSNILYDNKPHPGYQVFMEIYKAPSWQLSATYAWITFFVITCLMVILKNVSAYFFGERIWNFKRFSNYESKGISHENIFKLSEK